MTSAEKMSPDFSKQLNNTYSPNELSKLTTSYPLTRMLKSRRYDNADRYMVSEPEAVKRIDELYTEENLDAIKAYMLIGYLDTMSMYLDRESYDAYTEYYSILYGSTDNPEYEETALRLVREFLPTPISRLYLEKYDQTEKKAQITKMCEDVIDEYREMLKGEDWLSDETKEKAIEKLDAMGINAVYPEKWEDYSGLDLNGLSLYDQITEITRFNKLRDRAKTNAAVDRKIWDIGCDILTSNAYYEPTNNSIYILLGELDEPYYYDGISEAALLGSTGAGTIGHEISHAFDANGSQYDKDGNLSNWWTEEDRKAFEERADKLIKYFDGMTIWDGQNVLGENIQGEAIADIVGMKVILQHVKDRDDFDYDEFFTAFADSWKSLKTPELEPYLVSQDPHPMSYLRVNTTVQQFDEFYEAYDVKEGDNMYLAPEDRVSVW